MEIFSSIIPFSPSYLDTDPCKLWVNHGDVSIQFNYFQRTMVRYQEKLLCDQYVEYLVSFVLLQVCSVHVVNHKFNQVA